MRSVRAIVLRVNLARGEIFNETRGCSIQTNPMPEFMMTLLNEGGMVNYIRKYGTFQTTKRKGVSRKTISDGRAAVWRRIQKSRKRVNFHRSKC